MIQWDHKAIERIAREAERQVRAQARPVLEERIDGRFPLEDHSRGFSVGPEGVLAEYGTPDQAGTPWVMGALSGVR